MHGQEMTHSTYRGQRHRLSTGLITMVGPYSENVCWVASYDIVEISLPQLHNEKLVVGHHRSPCITPHPLPRRHRRRRIAPY